MRHSLTATALGLWAGGQAASAHKLSVRVAGWYNNADALSVLLRGNTQLFQAAFPLTLNDLPF